MRELREAVKADADTGAYGREIQLSHELTVRTGLVEMLRKHTFVGLVDMEVASALIQHGTALNLVQYESFALVSPDSLDSL